VEWWWASVWCLDTTPGVECRDGPSPRQKHPLIHLPFLTHVFYSTHSFPFWPGVFCLDCLVGIWKSKTTGLGAQHQTHPKPTTPPPPAAPPPRPDRLFLPGGSFFFIPRRGVCEYDYHLCAEEMAPAPPPPRPPSAALHPSPPPPPPPPNTPPPHRPPPTTPPPPPSPETHPTPPPPPSPHSPPPPPPQNPPHPHPHPRTPPPTPRPSPHPPPPPPHRHQHPPPPTHLPPPRTHRPCNYRVALDPTWRRPLGRVASPMPRVVAGTVARPLRPPRLVVVLDMSTRSGSRVAGCMAVTLLV
jgi:hypothetical protein